MLFVLLVIGMLVVLLQVGCGITNLQTELFCTLSFT